MVVCNQWIKGETKQKIRNVPKTNENEHTPFQNLWDAAKDLLRGMRGTCLAIEAYLKNQENPK